MRFRLEADIGGFLWWLFIKFCKTKLEDEQKEKKMVAKYFLFNCNWFNNSIRVNKTFKLIFYQLVKIKMN
ncbi:hypothetical protein MCETHM1_02765 [Flavobacteriaceae bacterium]